MTNSRSPDSFGGFYAAEIIGLHVFLRRQGAGDDDAWDACQDAFLEALRHWDGIGNAHAWVRTTAWRMYLKRQARAGEEAGRMTQAGWAPRPDFDKLEIPEQEARVLRLFALLPPRQRQVMAWHYDGYSNPEIAKILGITVDSVKSNLRHARGALKRLLLEDGEDGSSGGAR